MEKLIFKYLNNSLTEKESNELQQWLREDKDNIKIFENIVGEWNLSQQYIDKTKKKILSRVLSHNESAVKEPNFQKVISIATLRKISIAAAAVIALFIFNLYDFGFKGKPTTVVDSFETIESGKSKATLKLDNGKEIDLLEDQNLNLESDGTKIIGVRNSITYLQKKSIQAERKYNTLKTPRGGEFFLILSDSTKVWLNAESQIKYPVVFSSDKRTVELTGEAFFEVTPNPDKPFQVISGDQSIEVLGTSFNVTSYEDDAEIVTTLIEGKVNVNKRFGNKESIMLAPNEQSKLNRETGEMKNTTVDPNQFIAWKSGKFYFRQQKLKDITKVLSRWYDIEIFFLDSKTENKKFTGRFKRYENFDHVRSIIESTEEVTFIRKGKTIIIK
ncbi:FecR domain-containing protein [Flavobacteriaceae bacterium]|nr:FecR domain-containing protein [Flavobacteriaceae bacterium]